ncbi:MAG: biotin transporter BioY [Gemmatimonadales bacterium]
MSTAPSAAVTHAARPIGAKIVATLAGALVVAIAAQFALPLPGTPVPFTFSPLAVLVVGALLGPRLGAASLVTYLAMGAAGLPVFAPLGAPGLARLFGPTGGYLLAYPLAAAFAGWALRKAERPTLLVTLAACFGAMTIIFVGGLSQLLIMTGNVSAAFAFGLLPFLLADLAKVVLASLIAHRLLPLTRALS